MASDQNFLKDIDATYDSIFDNPEVSRAVQENYLLQVGISRGLNDFDNVDSSAKKKRIMDAMVTDLFSSRLASSGDVDNAQMPFVLDPKNPVSQNLIDSSMASGFKNPVTQENYKMGDTIYVIRKETSRSKKEETESKQKIDQYADILLRSDEDIKNMLEKVPLSITNRGTFEVFEGKILRNTGGGDRTEFPEISMAALREALRNASSTTRNQ